MFHGHAKKVVSDSLELVDFAIRLVMFVLNGNSNTEGLLSILLNKKGFGAR